MSQHEFLRDRIANAERNLRKPNIRYPNGRMSHDVEREVLAEAESKLFDLMIDGYYRADGSFAGFAQERTEMDAIVGRNGFCRPRTPGRFA